MNVDIPQSFAADDDKRVAQGPEGCAQRWNGPILGVKEIHHFVGRTACHQVCVDNRHRQRLRRAEIVAGEPAGQRVFGGVEHYDEGPPAGIDDPGPGEHFHLFGRMGQRHPGCSGGGGKRFTGVLAVPGGLSGPDGGSLGDGENRALDRFADRRIRCLGRQGEGTRDVGRIHRAVGGEFVKRRPDQLRQDHPGVAFGTREQADAIRFDHLGEARVIAECAEGFGAGDEGEIDVGAGVAVGDGEDIERVDLGPGDAQRLDAQTGPLGECRRGHRHAHGVRVSVEYDRGSGMPIRFASASPHRILLDGYPFGWRLVLHGHIDFVSQLSGSDRCGSGMRCMRQGTGLRPQRLPLAPTHEASF